VSVRYGFVIDQRKCIGCHACTVACKEENGVPLGAFRTWVKYVERGQYPDTRRYFAVLRCNHCDDAPCVTICPTVALYRRADGIVDFDGDRCIGCKSCMQGCPYDALYIDPDTNTAAKCHYCAHRVEVGLEPACVIVCPERAIVAGDLDDPRAPIAQLVAREPMQVRKPEQGTRPKVFYLGADAATLAPSLQAPAESYVFASRPADEVDLVRMVASVQDGAPGRPVYDAPHQPRPWGWKVAAYLWTKSIAAGVLMMAAAGVLIGAPPSSFLVGVFPPLLALLFLAATTGLLIFDLKRPDRFHYILVMGNRRSWLVKGTWILIAYGVIAAAWLVAARAADAYLLQLLALPALGLAAGAAGYSAFLFRQAEGRDFWQSPLLLPQLIVAAVVSGAAALLIVGLLAHGDRPSLQLIATALIASLVLEACVLLAEFSGSHANVDVARASRLLTRGALRGWFWGGVVMVGVAVPLVLMFTAALPIAPVLALTGLWIYEDAWIKAGQSIPLS
jgi:Fe-S-cluster-containing dehydrogenase component/formate-dependent nitrite reductase membrane component NrfD